MRINNNLMAMNAYRQLGITNDSASKSMEKLSSGLRINRAGDDAAGLSISEKMRAQIRGLSQASRNAQDGISLIQTAEGALQETQAILQRMRELAVQSANDTNVEIDRSAIQAEIDELASEITRIAKTTEFNTQKLLDGSFQGIFHIGANKGQNITLTVNKMDAYALGVEGNAAGVKLEDFQVVGTADTTNLNSADDISITDSAEEYTIEKLDNNVTILASNIAASATDVELGYVVKDADGKIVGAVDKDGQKIYFTKEAVDQLEDADFKTVDDNATVDLGAGNTITKGKITAYLDTTAGRVVVETDDAIAKFDATSGAKPLAAGEYMVSTTYALRGSADSALLDSNGNLVALGTISGTVTTFKDLNGKDLFTIANPSDGDKLTVAGGGGIDVSSQTAANNAITIINNAIEAVSTERSKLGAYQNRLEHTIKNLDTSAENLQASESRIRDVDMAKEMMEFTKNNILQQAATAMLAQANQAPQTVLQLLR